MDVEWLVGVYCGAGIWAVPQLTAGVRMGKKEEEEQNEEEDAEEEDRQGLELDL